MRTTLKRGIGRATAGNGNGHAVLPPGALSPVTRYQQPEKRRGALRTVGLILFILVALGAGGRRGVAGGAYIYTDESAHAFAPRSVQTQKAAEEPQHSRSWAAPANALVIGYDHRPEDGNSTVPLGHGHAPPRRPGHEHDVDALVPARPDRQRALPDGRTYSGRINEAYSYCGPAGTLETVRSLTGLPIHYLITVNFQGFRDIVNKLGGVWMDVDRRYYNPTRRRLRDDQPLARLPEARRLAGARLRPLPAHRLRPLPPRAPAALRQGREAGGERDAGRTRRRSRSSFEVMSAQRRGRPEEGRALGEDARQLRVLRLRAPVRELRPGQDRGAHRLRTSSRTDPSNIRRAVQEFLHPDVDAAAEGDGDGAAAEAARRRTARARRRSPSSS